MSILRSIVWILAQELRSIQHDYLCKMYTAEYLVKWYNVSNNLEKISTCEEDCELCKSSDDYCIYQIGEWLISESDK